MIEAKYPKFSRISSSRYFLTRSVTEVKYDRYFQHNSYENEVHDFVEKLLNQISAVENSETGKVDCFIFEDESQFTERHLLWGCFDLLIKAELTIGSLKRSRLKLMQELLKQDNTE